MTERMEQVLPEGMKALPFCCWKREKDANGRDTKVPYNPKTGHRGKTNTASDFGTLEEALASCRGGKYAGLGFSISEEKPGEGRPRVGGIDLDDCMEDGVPDSRAREVLEMLPQAYAEYSPSRRGLHAYFQLPEGFAFDRDEYYINNRKNKTEIYLPGVTHHFLTVTGEVYRGGSMEVTAEQLQRFLDRYMRREQRAAGAASPPEGGSVLSDGEVILKLAREKDGERWMKLLRGEWEDCAGDGDPNWSHSEADYTLCLKLAFYCRGDMEQMDRIFRESGLMRDKWDRQTGGATYGEITMANAVKRCSAFYEPPERLSAVEDFADGMVEDSGEEAAEDPGAQLDRLLCGEMTPERLLEEETLRLAAWAYGHDALRYARLRGAIPKKVGVKIFEKAMKQWLPAEKRPEGVRAMPLCLEGISAPGMVVPAGWTVDENGICLTDEEGMVTRVSPEPLFVSAKMENADDGSEKLELTYRRNGRYRTLIAPRSDLLNRNAIIQYADAGVPVSSGTAGGLTRFIAEMEAVNNRTIPLKRCTRRAGWIGEEFFPYCLRGPLLAQEDREDAERLLEHLHESGDREVWLAMALRVRKLPFARAMLAASFASPLLYPLQHRNIYYHNWHDSRSGKTAVLKFAMSVWGNPAGLVKSYFSTMVGLEHRAGTMGHLPLALDELQAIDRKLDLNNVVYTLGNGVGKTRGRAGGGIRPTDSWQSCILSTGEMPISRDSSMDGINTRLLEIYGRPVVDEAMAEEMHRVCEQHYGFAAEPYIRFLAARREKIREDFEWMRGMIDVLDRDGGAGRDNIAVLALADVYASVSVFGMEEGEAWAEALEMAGALMDARGQEDHTDAVDRAWAFVSGWVAGNKDRFTNLSHAERYGTIEKGAVWVICTTLNRALEEAGFSYRKSIRGFAERGYLKVTEDSEGKKRSQAQKKVDGVNARVYILNIDVAAGPGIAAGLGIAAETQEDEPFLM